MDQEDPASSGDVELPDEESDEPEGDAAGVGQLDPTWVTQVRGPSGETELIASLFRVKMRRRSA